jgi:hypothetical protein
MYKIENILDRFVITQFTYLIIRLLLFFNTIYANMNLLC